MSAVALTLEDFGDRRAAFGDAAAGRVPVVRPLARPVKKKRVQVAPVLHANDKSMESGAMTIERSLPVSDSAVDAFRERLGAALRRRVGSHTGFTVKHLAYLCHASEQLVWQWMCGEKMPSGPKLVKLIALFDAAFVHEILSVVGKGVYDLHNQRIARQAERDDATANAIRALAAIAPLLDGEDAA